jgi:hypothetical protein
MEIIKDKDTVILSCGKGKCCPILSKIEGGMYRLEDDFEGHVTLTKEQLLIIHKAVQALDE